MKRVFFRKPIITRVKDEFYIKVVRSCEKYQNEHCNKVNGRYPCSECPFDIKPYCLLNILKKEFGEKDGKRKKS